MKRTLKLIFCFFEMFVTLVSVFVFLGCETKKINDPLTSQEREWLTRHDGNITMALETSYAPFAFVDENGIGNGLANEYIELIEKKLSFRIKKIQFNSLNEILNSAQKKEIDIVNAVTETQGRSKYLLFTKPFIEIPNVIIVKKDRKDSLTIDKMENMKVALVKNYAVTEHLKQNFNELNVVLTPDDLSALISVSFNQTDATIIDLATASYFIEQKGITNLRIAGESGYSIKLAIAAREDWPILNQILNKGLDLITQAEKDTIYRNWISLGDISFYKSRDFWIISSSIASIIFTVFFMVLIWNRNLKRLVEHRTATLEKQTVDLKKEIAGREQAEEELRKSEERYRSLINFSPLPILVTKEEKIVFINPAMISLFGVKNKSEIIDSSPNEWLHPNFSEKAYQRRLQVLEKGKTTEPTELVFILKDDRQISVLANSSYIIHNGKPAILSAFQDITERKKIEVALQDSETKYRSMMESMTDPVYICSPEFSVEYMNPAMIKRIGRDAVGEKCYNVLHNLDSKCDWCVFGKVTEGQSLETTIISPKDNRYYRVTNMPIQNKNGSISKMTIFRDITDYLTAVAEKEKAQEQLLQLQKMESIGNLAGGIAHDFNNLLFPIIGLSELLIEDLPPDSPERENAKEILSAGKRGAELVKQILAFSRQTEFRKIPIRLEQILKEVIKLSRSTIPSDIEILKNIQTDCGLVLADPTQMHQITMNLITNAYHAVEAKGGKISIELKETTISQDLLNSPLDSGQYAVLTVTDNGCGIPSKILDKIFEPYFTTKGVGKGTGLGLAVVHGIIKDHHGHIKVVSEPGKGSSFAVYLPIMGEPSDSKVVKALETDPTGNERILLVDDEEPIIKLLTQMLEKLGYHVTSITSSDEALKIFKASPDLFDIVISDMTMPKMTGDFLAKEVMSIRPDIPVIICSGFSERIDKEKAESLGIKNLLMKPVIKSEMARAIRKALDDAKIIHP